MKKIHFILLLAGLLAVGSAFTTTKTHRAPCDNLPLAHKDDAGKIIDINADGECSGSLVTCVWADENHNGTYTRACDELPRFVENTH